MKIFCKSHNSKKSVSLQKRIPMAIINKENAELAVNQYLDYLTQHPDGDEIQYRTAIEVLFNAIKLPAKKITIIQEDRRSGLEIDGICVT